MDSLNNRIQQITSDGTATVFVSGGFNTPGDIAVDSGGFVYVVNEGTQSVMKFASDGTSVTGENWAPLGFLPAGIAIDDSDLIYIVDEENHGIEIFTSDGTPQSGWGTPGTGDG